MLLVKHQKECKPLKIALFTPNFPPETGACSLRIFHLAEALRKAGHTPVVFTFLPNYPTGRFFKGFRLKAKADIRTENGLKVIRLPFFPAHSPSALKRGLSMLSAGVSALCFARLFKREKPDLAFAQTPPLPLAAAAAVLARRLRVPFISNFSDLHPSALYELGAFSVSSPAYTFLKRLESYVIRHSRLCVAQSEESKSYLEACGAKKTLLCRTGADTDLFVPGEKSLSQNGNEPFRIIYAGLLGAAQGMASLCRAIDFKALGAELHIYGEGYEAEEIRRILIKRPEKGIYLHKFIPQHELAQRMQSFDAALVVMKTSVKGTVPSKIYEAASCGLPVIFQGTGEGAALVHDFGKVVLPGDFNALAEALKSLKEMVKEDKEKYSLKARRKALEEFDRGSQVAALLAVIAEYENSTGNEI